jgi:T5SS/PEP-CTERM-associated repeat protein
MCRLVRTFALQLYACLAAVSLISYETAAHGQTIIDWTNPAGGSYHTAANWNPANVPNAATETARFNLDSALVIQFNANSNTTIDDLQVQQGGVVFRNAGVNIDARLNISDDAILDGGSLALSRATGGTADVNLVIQGLLSIIGGSGLRIFDSAQVEANTLQLGNLASGNGFIIVDGAGSMLDITGTTAAVLGANGRTGTLIFQNGSTGNSIAGDTNLGVSIVSNSRGFLDVVGGSTLQTADINVGTTNQAAPTGQQAIIEVEGMGSSLTMSGASALTVGSLVNDNVEPKVQIGSGGTFNTGTGAISIRNTGVLEIFPGGTFNANGNVTVDGGRITNALGNGNANTVYGSFNLAAGRNLIIAGGGTFTYSSNFILQNGSTARVTGLGSTWTNSQFLTIGDTNAGTLIIERGGSVASKMSTVAEDPMSTGMVTVTGDGSKWTHSESLVVGFSGTGTAKIELGGSVSNTLGTVGTNSNSVGTVTVTGTGSKWTNSGSLTVGYEGKGTLNIEAGGAVSNTDGVIASEPVSTSDAKVTGMGSMWTNIGVLAIGSKGKGTLTIDAGGKVTSDGGVISSQAGAAGAAIIKGAGSTWSNIGSLTVGNLGTGTLRIEQGGSVSNGIDTRIAAQPNSTGEVTVNGAGSTWTNALLAVGNSGNGTLSIENAGKVVVGQAGTSIGSNDGSTGKVTVTGPQSILANAGPLAVGFMGAGTLKIEAGGEVTSVGTRQTPTAVGFHEGSTGEVTITGAGSTWTEPGLFVGGAGSGMLKIDMGGRVSTESVALGVATNSTGTVTVGGAGSLWSSSQGLTIGGDGRGTLVIERGGMCPIAQGKLPSRQALPVWSPSRAPARSGPTA